MDCSSNSSRIGSGGITALGRPPLCATAAPRLFHKVVHLPLVLASSSVIRAAMLGQAGIEYVVCAPSLDEDAVKESHHGDDQNLTLTLAEAKALSIAASADDWIIGSDSVISIDGVRYSKPRDRAEAAAHLDTFSGRMMLLSSAVALVRDGRVDWSHAETAHLKVRMLSPAFITSYLEAEWPDVSYCVGVFRMEGRGVTLFENVEGSHFTILGMPLIPLLRALRQRDALPS